MAPAARSWRKTLPWALRNSNTRAPSPSSSRVKDRVSPVRRRRRRASSVAYLRANTPSRRDLPLGAREHSTRLVRTSSRPKVSKLLARHRVAPGPTSSGSVRAKARRRANTKANPRGLRSNTKANPRGRRSSSRKASRVRAGCSRASRRRCYQRKVPNRRVPHPRGRSLRDSSLPLSRMA